ncbi:P-loop containing nucleoside triphosphate hydrolase protein [Rhizophagus clarus]|nr:P-loop containing nucleoside triphosphate hydrolase protein [Rhizophagus clarus]
MTNIQENSNKAEKRILLIGSSGSGKSTLGNVLINRSDNFEKVFDEGDYSISKIKNISEPVKVEIEGINYSIIDTPGFDDTSLEVTKIPPTLTKLDECTKLGVDYILLVVNRRFTSKDLEVSKYLKDIFFEENVVEYITIVFTHFSGFKNKKICEENINKLRNENDSIFNIINNVRIIHVNNPPPPDDEEDSVSSAKRAKENSRKTILDHLKLYQNEEKCKPRSGNLHERVKIFNEKELKDMKQRHIDFGEWVEGINHYIEWRKHMKNDLTNYKIICLCILLIVRLWQSTEDAFL